MEFVDIRRTNVPALGFGTYELLGDDCRRMVERALALGYRHIDTATIYHNEDFVGQGLANSAVSRNEVFLTTKVWPDSFRAPAFRASVEGSLKKLQTDYVDLLLLHWPNPAVPLEEILGELNAACRAGLARHIGLSNFTVPLIAEACKLSDLPLAMNQVEYHPLLDQSKLLAEMRSKGLALTAYSPLAQGNVIKEPLLRQIGETHGRSAIQVGLRWLIDQPNVLAIPRSSNEDHAAANLDIFDFELTVQETAQINALTKQNLRTCSPDELAPDWD